MVVDGWLRYGIRFTADSVGQCPPVSSPVLFLSGQVPHRRSVQVLPPAFSAAGNPGSSPGFANDSTHTQIGYAPRLGHDITDCFPMRQDGPVHFESRAELACLVSG